MRTVKTEIKSESQLRSLALLSLEERLEKLLESPAGKLAKGKARDVRYYHRCSPNCSGDPATGFVREFARA